jgi:hypothetical protein
MTDAGALHRNLFSPQRRRNFIRNVGSNAQEDNGEGAIFISLFQQLDQRSDLALFIADDLQPQTPTAAATAHA